MAVITRSAYLARWGDSRDRLFDPNRTGGGTIRTAFRDDLGWPIVPLPVSFSLVSNSIQWADETIATLREEGRSLESGRWLEWIDDLDEFDRRDVMVEALWRPLFALIGKVGGDTLVATSMIEWRYDGRGAFIEEEHAIEFRNDWSSVSDYSLWPHAKMDDAVIFDRTLGWGIHSLEEIPFCFFASRPELVDQYLESIGGAALVRECLERQIDDELRGYSDDEVADFRHRFNTLIGKPPFVTAVKAGPTERR